MQYNGKCGICGDPYGASPRNHEAPGGRYANGIIVREYKIGQVIDVQVDVTANHKGNFQFKLCPNNNILQDSDQSCFDRYASMASIILHAIASKKKNFCCIFYLIFFFSHILKVYPKLTDYYTLPSDMPGTFKLKLKLPDGLTCSQCVLQVSG